MESRGIEVRNLGCFLLCAMPPVENKAKSSNNKKWLVNFMVIGFDKELKRS